jgi:HEAT repeat protein
MAAEATVSVPAEVRRILEELPPSGALEPALRAFDKIGRPGKIMAHLRLLGASDPEARIRYQAERFLKAIRAHRPPADFGSPPDRSRIKKGLRSQDPDVRVDATKALRVLPPEHSFPLLLEAIERPEEDPWVLSSMVSLLGLTGRPEVTDLLARLSDHSSPRVAANALLALFAVAPSRGVEAARDHLEDADPRMRASAVMATFTAEPELAWEQVLEMLRSEHVWMRTSGSYLAAKLDHEDSEQALLEALLKEDDPAIVIRTLKWFGRCGTDESVDTLELLAKLGDPRYRAHAQASLEQVRERLAKDAKPHRERPAAIIESGFNLQDTLQGARSAEEVRALAEAARAAAAEAKAAAAAAAAEEGEDSDTELEGDVEGEAEGEELEEPVSEDGVLSSSSLLQAMVDDELEGQVPEPVSSEELVSEDVDSSRPARTSTATVAMAVPSRDGGFDSQRMAKAGAALIVVVSGALLLHIAYSWTSAPPPPSTPPKPTTRPKSAATQVKVVDGKVSINSLPRAGQVGTFEGLVASTSKTQVVLDLDAGARITFHLQESLENLPARGTPVRLVGRVFRKRRGGVTLMPGASLVKTTPEEEP